MTDVEWQFQITRDKHLIATIVNQSRDSFFKLCGLPVAKEILDFGPERAIAFAESTLCPFGGKRFDPVSRVDLVVRRSLELAVPIEVKLGYSGLSWRKLDTEHLRPCSPSHKGARWQGNMLAILDRRFDSSFVGDPHGELRVKIGQGNETVLTHEWYIIARGQVLDQLSKMDKPLSAKLQFVAFEDVAKLPGRDGFNEIIRSHMPADFYGAWVSAVRPKVPNRRGALPKPVVPAAGCAESRPTRP